MSLLSYGQGSGGAAADNASRRRSLVILTPLVDVVFILLVFFMLASSFSEQRVISILAPAAVERASSTQVTGSVLIRIGRDGSLNLSGQPMSLVDLAQEVAGRSIGDVKYSYLVQPDAGVSLQQVVSLVDLLKSSGARAVSLIRRP